MPLILAHRPPVCFRESTMRVSPPPFLPSRVRVQGGQVGRSSMRESNRSCLIGHTPWNRIQYHIHVSLIAADSKDYIRYSRYLYGTQAHNEEETGNAWSSARPPTHARPLHEWQRTIKVHLFSQRSRWPLRRVSRSASLKTQ